MDVYRRRMCGLFPGSSKVLEIPSELTKDDDTGTNKIVEIDLTVVINMFTNAHWIMSNDHKIQT